MRIARTAAVVAATALLSLTAACGEDKPGPQVATEEFIQAMLDEDTETACKLLSTEGKKLTEDEVEECSKDTTGTDMDADERKEAEKFLKDGPEKVTEDGDKAVVTYKSKDEGDDDILLIKVDGDWLLDLG